MTDARNPWDPPTVEEVIGPILAACPSFAGVWAAAAGSQWAGSEANGYWVMVELANHLVALRRRGETGEIGATFDQIEVMLGEADASLEEILTVHFIAGLQEDAKRSGDWAFSDGFTPFLGPQMTAAWRWAFLHWKAETGVPPSL